MKKLIKSIGITFFTILSLLVLMSIVLTPVVLLGKWVIPYIIGLGVIGMIIGTYKELK